MLWLSRLSSANPTNTVATHGPWGAPPTNHGSPRRPRVPAPFFHMGTGLGVSASSAKGGEGKTTEDGKKFSHQ